LEYKKRGQAATEYLIILAVVVIIALIVVVILGGFPGIGRGTSAKASSAYWSTATPIGISSYDISDTAASNSFRLVNNAPTTINVSSITLDGTSIGMTAVSILPGQTKTAAFTAFTCTSGETYELDVIITYANPDTGETGLKFTGDIELIGECLDI
jgi:archaellum component FlaF (FlaF/FlaG flagellin family)